MNVKGFKTLQDSFVDYISVETLDGDNRYQAEGYGLQVRPPKFYIGCTVLYLQQ
jgi:hypothetical protein